MCHLWEPGLPSYLSAMYSGFTFSVKSQDTSCVFWACCTVCYGTGNDQSCWMLQVSSWRMRSCCYWLREMETRREQNYQILEEPLGWHPGFTLPSRETASVSQYSWQSQQRTKDAAISVVCSRPAAVSYLPLASMALQVTSWQFCTQSPCMTIPLYRAPFRHVDDWRMTRLSHMDCILQTVHGHLAGTFRTPTARTRQAFPQLTYSPPQGNPGRAGPLIHSVGTTVQSRDEPLQAS